MKTSLRILFSNPSPVRVLAGLGLLALAACSGEVPAGPGAGAGHGVADGGPSRPAPAAGVHDGEGRGEGDSDLGTLQADAAVASDARVQTTGCTDTTAAGLVTCLTRLVDGLGRANVGTSWDTQQVATIVADMREALARLETEVGQSDALSRSRACSDTAILRSQSARVGTATKDVDPAMAGLRKDIAAAIDALRTIEAC